MPSVPQETVIAVLAAIAMLVVGVLAARWIDGRAGWPGAGAIALIASTPLLPHAEIAVGISLDDVLPVVGLVLLIPIVIRVQVPRETRIGRWPLTWGATIALIGTCTLVLAGILSALANASDVVGLLRLGLRGAGRAMFLVAIVAAVATTTRTPQARRFAAYVVVAVGVFEAIFGLIAYVVPLPFNIGLEIARQNTVLYGEIPGRIAGTLGISPNFTGAMFIVTILLTAGFAIEMRDRRRQAAWWGAVLLQLLALTLTFTRVSLALALAGLVLLVIVRGRRLVLLPIALTLGVVAVGTPILTRLLGDANDRLALWTSAVRLMFDHPLFGVGAGRMLEAARADPGRYVDTPFGTATSTAHNTIFLAGAEAGIPGAVGAFLIHLGLAILALQVFRTAIRRGGSDQALVASIALGAILVQAMVNNLFTVGVTSTLTAFLIGSQLLVRDREASLPRSGSVGLLQRPEASPVRTRAVQRAGTWDDEE